MDTDGDGLLTAAEVAAGHHAFCAYSSSYRRAHGLESPAACFAEADIDGDGVVGVDEFVTYCEKTPGRAEWVFAMVAIVEEEAKKA